LPRSCGDRRHSRMITYRSCSDGVQRAQDARHRRCAVTPVALDLTGPLQGALTAVVRFVPTFVAFLVILLAGWIVARVLRAVARRMLTRVRFAKAVERGGLTRVPYDPADLLARLVYYAVLLFTLQLAFGVW